MSQDDGRQETRRRTENGAPAPQKSTPKSLEDLPTGKPLPKTLREREEVDEAPEPERRTVNSAALLAELDNLDPDEWGKLLISGAPRRYRPGDKIEGEVVRVDGFTAFVDIGAKSEATLSTDDMEEQPKVGDTVEAFVLRADGRGIQISQKLGGRDADIDVLEEAMEAEVPIEGRVVSHNPGGFTVRIGQVSAFCPRSQIDRIVAEDLEQYTNQTYTFRVIDIEGSKVVISRRVILEAALEESAAALWEKLAPGDALDGVVANVREFGVFVDIGGIQGLVSKRELGWEADEANLPKRGDKVRVRVLDVDRARKRVSMSLKDPAFSPWNQVGTQFIEGGVYDAKVVRLTDFGAFLRLAPGLEGLCHISNIANKRTEHPSDALNVGDAVRVRVLNIDVERKRIGLGIKQADDANYSPEDNPAPAPRVKREPVTLGTMADLFGGLSVPAKKPKKAVQPPNPNKKKKKRKKKR